MFKNYSSLYKVFVLSYKLQYEKEFSQTSFKISVLILGDIKTTSVEAFFDWQNSKHLNKNNKNLTQ